MPTPTTKWVTTAGLLELPGANRLNVLQHPKTLFEPQRSMTSRSWKPR